MSLIIPLKRIRAPRSANVSKGSGTLAPRFSSLCKSSGSSDSYRVTPMHGGNACASNSCAGPRLASGCRFVLPMLHTEIFLLSDDLYQRQAAYAAKLCELHGRSPGAVPIPRCLSTRPLVLAVRGSLTRILTSSAPIFADAASCASWISVEDSCGSLLLSRLAAPR